MPRIRISSSSVVRIFTNPSVARMAMARLTSS